MALSKRFIRAGFTFLLLGTVAAVLPQQDNTAADASGCTQGSHTFTLASNSSGTASYNYAPSTTKSTSKNIVYPFFNGSPVKNLSSYTETINYTDTSTTDSGITLLGYTKDGVNGTVAQPSGGMGSFSLSSATGGYAFNFLENKSGVAGNFSVTLVTGGQTYYATATLSG